MKRIAVVLAAAMLPLCAQSGYKAPRTPAGVPDLTGIYLNRTNVPLERPANLGAKEFYTPEEFAAREKAAAERAAQQAAAPAGREDPHYDSEQFGLDSATSGLVKSLRTSLITGPTGRIPPLLPAAQQRFNAQQAARRGHEFDSAEMRSLSERCILWSFEGPPVLPGGYNPNLQIHQGYGFVAVRYEMMGGARIIPTDGRPHIDPNIRLWYGDSVGHWEGDTLVVDTTNFTDQPALGRGSDRNLHVVERFTRTGPDTITYQFTVSDPTVWEQSWSGEYTIERIEGNIYEYACHEGNYGLPNILNGARAAEREAAAAK